MRRRSRRKRRRSRRRAGQLARAKDNTANNECSSVKIRKGLFRFNKVYQLLKNILNKKVN